MRSGERRKGTGYSVEFPASVVFEICLIKVKDGRVFWNGRLDETQRSLSENLFRSGTFLKKSRWITAEDTAVSVIEDVLKTFPYYDYYTCS